MSSPSCHNVAPKLFRSCLKVVPNLSQAYHAQTCLKSGLNDYKNCPKLVQKLSLSCLKVAPKLAQSSLKLPKNFTKIFQSCPKPVLRTSRRCFKVSQNNSQSNPKILTWLSQNFGITLRIREGL